MFRAPNTAKHIMAALFAYKVNALCTSNLHFIKCCSTATHKTQFWWNLGWEGGKPQAPSSYCTGAMPWGLLQGSCSPAEVRTPAGPWALGPAACQAVVGSLDVCTVACLACCFGGDGLVGGFSTTVPSWAGHQIWSFVLPPVWWLPLQPTPVMVAGMARRGLHCCAVAPEPGSLPTSLPLLLAPSNPNMLPWNQHVLFCPHLQENPALPLGWMSFPRGCPPRAAPEPSQLISPMLVACGPTATPTSFEPTVGKQCPLCGEEQGKAPLAPFPRGRRMRGQQSHQAQSAIACHSGGYPLHSGRGTSFTGLPLSLPMARHSAPQSWGQAQRRGSAGARPSEDGALPGALVVCCLCSDLLPPWAGVKVQPDRAAGEATPWYPGPCSCLAHTEWWPAHFYPGRGTQLPQSLQRCPVRWRHRYTVHCVPERPNKSNWQLRSFLGAVWNEKVGLC